MQGDSRPARRFCLRGEIHLGNGIPANDRSAGSYRNEIGRVFRGSACTTRLQWSCAYLGASGNGKSRHAARSAVICMFVRKEFLLHSTRLCSRSCPFSNSSPPSNGRSGRKSEGSSSSRFSCRDEREPEPRLAACAQQSLPSLRCAFHFDSLQSVAALLLPVLVPVLGPGPCYARQGSQARHRRAFSAASYVPFARFPLRLPVLF